MKPLQVWLDGNFLTGTIPADIATRWPELQSLDLYDNDLTGAIPAGLGELAWHKLQLHSNNLTGEVPCRGGAGALREFQADLARVRWRFSIV